MRTTAGKRSIRRTLGKMSDSKEKMRREKKAKRRKSTKSRIRHQSTTEEGRVFFQFFRNDERSTGGEWG